MANRRMSSIGFMIAVVALLQSANAYANTIFTVGDSLGWTVPSNNSLDFYENWSENNTFQIGDSLLFNWTGTHTATEVANEEDYGNCEKTGIALVTSGVIVPLNANGTRYFVCSIGTHCEQGMKVAIKVGNGIAPPPPPPSAAPLHFGYIAAFLSPIAILFFNYV